MMRLHVALLLLFLISCGEFKHSNNRPFRVSVSQQLPFHIITKLPDGTYSYTGINSKHFYYVAQKLNRPLVVVVPTDEDLKTYGYVQASLNQVLNGEADVSGMATVVDVEQLPLIDLTFPTAMSSFKMLVPAAQEESRLFAFIRPFQPMVWLFFFVSLVGSIIAASGLGWMSSRIDQQQQNPSRIEQRRAAASRQLFTSFLVEYCVYTVGIITSHGSRNPFTRNGLRIFGALWLLVMTVLVYAYSGLLIGCLTVPAMTKPIETLEDVAASTEVVLYINPNALSGMGKAVMEGKSGVWKALGDQMRRRPDGLYTKTLTQVDFNVSHQNYATPQLANYLIWMVRQLYKKEKKCRFHLTKSIPFSVRILYVLSHKGDVDNEKINLAIMELRENGLLDYYSNQGLYVPGSGGADQCFKKKKNSAKNVPIKLVDLTSAFFILGIGTGLAILCFLLELIVGKYKREMEMRNAVVAPLVIEVRGEDKDNAIPAQVVNQKNENEKEVVVAELV